MTIRTTLWLLCLSPLFFVILSVSISTIREMNSEAWLNLLFAFIVLAVPFIGLLILIGII